MSHKFSEYLLAKYDDDFDTATRHPFLLSAGQGTLDKDVLERWLRQDYLYAFVGYVKFASLLLSRLPVPSAIPSPSTAHHLTPSGALSRAHPLLLFSLTNISRETSFFVSTATAHGLALHTRAAGDRGTMGETIMPDVRGEDDRTGLLGEYEPVTRSYVDFLVATAAGRGVEEGLVALWAMEKAYLTAWTFARSHNSKPTPEDATSGTHTETQKALDKFIDNWTNDEFVGFVNECEEVVDGLGIEVGSELGERCEQVFRQVLWLEQRFWPAVELA
ncbi:hypothetical protein JCM24511_00566 [Saitozyma sp. JCM 24511]|nr:hypothetical protein JCM24511_00566 [Saitozyma sp. JCM 24511]